MNNEVLEYDALLNKYSDQAYWRYIPWEDLNPCMTKNTETPICLVAFESKQGAGIDPYYGLPYEKYLYFVQKNKPRNNVKSFLSQTGRNFGPLLNHESNGRINIVKYIPSMTYSKNRQIAEAIPQPPIVEAKLSLTFSATLTPVDTAFAKAVEIEFEHGKGFSAKANGAFDHLMASFKLGLGASSIHQIDMGVQSSVLVGEDGRGSFTSRAVITPLGPGLWKAKSSGSYSNSDSFSFDNTDWSIEYSIGYEVEATVEENGLNNRYKYEFNTYDLRVPSSNTIANPILRGGIGRGQESWWDSHKDEIAVGARLPWRKSYRTKS
jgi:hypothetical protein